MGPWVLFLALIFLIGGCILLIGQAAISFPAGMVAILIGSLFIGVCAWLQATK